MNKERRTKNIVVIDTADNKRIKVGLRLGSGDDIIEQEVGRDRAQVVLPLLDSLLKKHDLTLQDISGIAVNVGPGSFTGLRVGVSIANALGYALYLPINDGEPGQPVEPVYT